MSNHTWDTPFLELFDRCVAKYRSGNEDFTSYYGAGDDDFLRSIGCKPREFFDFVEDLCDMGGPSRESALLIASVRRDFLATIQKGVHSETEIVNDDLPARDAELGGFAWLPRIIVKARGKLRGELHPDIMFSCGGDRQFLQAHDIHPADFLRAVWGARDDDEKILAFVTGSQ